MGVTSRKFSKEQSRVVQQSFLTGFNAGAARYHAEVQRKQALDDLAQARAYQAQRDDETRKQQAFLQASREKAAADRAEKLEAGQWSRFQATQAIQQYNTRVKSSLDVAQNVLKNPHKFDEKSLKWAQNFIPAVQRDQQRLMTGIQQTRPGDMPRIDYSQFESPALEATQGNPLYLEQMRLKNANIQSSIATRKANLGLAQSRFSLAQEDKTNAIIANNRSSQVIYDDAQAALREYQTKYPSEYGPIEGDPTYNSLKEKVLSAKKGLTKSGVMYDQFMQSSRATPDYQRFHTLVKENVGDPTNPNNRAKLLEFSSQASQTPEAKAFIDQYLLDTIGGTSEDFDESEFDNDEDDGSMWITNDTDATTPEGLLMPLSTAPDPAHYSR